MNDLIIKNIDKIVSGDINKGIIPGDTIVVRDGLIAAIGSPISSSYAPSCLGPGEDGELIYNGFTVYTYRENGVETVEDVL